MTLDEMNERAEQMMSNPIVARGAEIKEIGGVKYVHRRRSALLAMQVHGSAKVLGMVAGAAAEGASADDVKRTLSEAAQENMLTIMDQTLQVYMIHPRVVADPADVVPGQACMMVDLGDDAFELFLACSGDGSEVDPTPGSSESDQAAATQ